MRKEQELANGYLPTPDECRDTRYSDRDDCEQLSTGLFDENELPLDEILKEKGILV